MANNNKTGRPNKEIDLIQFKKYCELQCTLMDIAGMFECSHDTIERWCKNKLGMTFGKAFQIYRAPGLVSLRKTQFDQAKSNPTMSIWLGKIYLDQKDNITITSNNAEDDPLTKSIKEKLIKSGELIEEEKKE